MLLADGRKVVRQPGILDVYVEDIVSEPAVKLALVPAVAVPYRGGVAARGHVKPDRNCVQNLCRLI